LIDQLGPGQLAAVVRLLETMAYDDGEELTGDDREAVAASREYFRRNPEGGVSFEQVVAELRAQIRRGGREVECRGYGFSSRGPRRPLPIGAWLTPPVPGGHPAILRFRGPFLYYGYFRTA
jgi:hypothetical protein